MTTGMAIPSGSNTEGEDGAVDGLDGLDGPDLQHDATCRAGHICYGSWRHPPNDKVYVKDGRAGTHYPNGMHGPAIAGTCPGGSFVGAEAFRW